MERTQLDPQLAEILLPWYDGNRRRLPWREDRKPYHIWLSEIMLQQTRVEAVKGYYRRFLQALPTVKDLAGADDDALRKLWEGLGYYSRVANLKKAAVQIMDIYGGAFPTEHSQVLALPGIGPYTAGAICSIAFNQKTPAVDGNVLRVVSRLTADKRPADDISLKKDVEAALLQIYPDRAGDFTQALMELGATVCGPNKAPDCENCPCKAICQGYRAGDAQRYPGKKQKLTRRQEDMTVFILECDGQYALQKRPEKGLLASLWQFPNVGGKLAVEDALEYLSGLGLKPTQILRSVERKHIFTHVQWNMRGIYAQVSLPIPEYVWMDPRKIRSQAALPTAFRLFWEEIENV